MKLFVDKIVPPEEYKHRKKNAFDITGEKGVMILYDGTECYFDKEAELKYFGEFVPWQNP